MKDFLFGMCIALALVLLISDGDYFPIPNVIGAGIFLIIAACLPKPRRIYNSMASHQMGGERGDVSTHRHC